MSEPATLSHSDYQRTLLSGLELFNGMRPDDVSDLLSDCQRLDIQSGDTLLSPGQTNDNVYIVLCGELNVHIGARDASIVATLGPGACVGEMSIIEDRDPSAYVIATEETHLLVIHRDTLQALVEASHQFCKNLLIVLSERVRSHNHFIAESFGDLHRYERHASTDALTGLSNRHSMEETFPVEVQRCIDERISVSLIMIDVDSFKSFNDKFGHVAGDRALSAVGQILRKQFRPRDLLVRYGGDEFAVLLPGATQAEALAIAERVRQAISVSDHISDDSLIKIPVNVSMGVAELDTRRSFEELLRAADEALYRAKDAGRNVVST